MNSSSPVIKNFKDWRVRHDPPPDVHIVRFTNRKLNYHSYYAPEGYTPEEILQFPGAKRCLPGTADKVKEWIETNEKKGICDARTRTVWKKKPGSDELFDTGITY
ncbi:hypothetical protein BT96DRAFT_925357 [Gymnopus androsaceus JB14]|uniref:Uncharacterized protein n=1 Tax=Gymnopus androsaceus JB14 TaxID=1447944 RepID=A0A6A4H102_9AGAR|nr:hypothetical protein BT96DRAFT_925357 [Gymnopus androsaceus JB14]